MDSGQLSHHQTLTLAGNALDVGNGPALWEIVVSIDTVHKPGSVKVVRPEETPMTEYFETFQLFSDLSEDAIVNGIQDDGSTEADLRWEPSSLSILLNNAAAGFQKGELPPEELSKDRGKEGFGSAGEMLYGLENLRKKREAAIEAGQE
jgi:hypothetical protein